MACAVNELAHPLDPEIPTVAFLVNRLELIPVEWSWHAQLFPLDPVGDQPGQFQTFKPIRMHDGFDVHSLIVLASFALVEIQHLLESLQSQDDAEFQSVAFLGFDLTISQSGLAGTE